MDDILSGRGDVSVVELRVTRLPQFAGRLDVVPIRPEIFSAAAPDLHGRGHWRRRQQGAGRGLREILVSPEGQA